MSEWEPLGRLLLAVLLGTIVGIERQWHHKTAGLKTNTLVAVGSTAFALVSEYGFGAGSNPAQVAAGVVTGIGFIGGGVIMRRAGNVQGINTAATLWATASIGLATGQGFYRLAIFIFLAVLMIQFAFRGLAMWIDQRSGFIIPLVTYHLTIECAPSAAASVKTIWADFSKQTGVCVNSYSESQSATADILIISSFGLSELRQRDLVELGQKLGAVSGIVRTEWIKQEVKESVAEKE